MTREQRHAAKLQLVTAMQAGQSWQDAAQAAGLIVSRSTAYSWRLRFEREGPAALQDGRHGHPRTLLGAAHHWLLDFCRAHPAAPSPAVQRALHAQWGITLSVNYLNRLRAHYHLRVRTPPPRPVPLSAP
jgi:transposase